jgi:hypothetical protein
MSGMVVCEISQKIQIIYLIFLGLKNTVATGNDLTIQNL